MVSGTESGANVRRRSTAVHPLSWGNRQQWADSEHLRPEYMITLLGRLLSRARPASTTLVPQRRFAATMIGLSATSHFAGDKSNGCIRVILRSSRHSLGS